MLGMRLKEHIRVVVSRPGFETTTSREVVIPPPVTDLDVALTPTDRTKPEITTSGVTEGNNYTDPVTINVSSSDDEAGVRYITYKIDGNEASGNKWRSCYPSCN